MRRIILGLSLLAMVASVSFAQEEDKNSCCKKDKKECSKDKKECSKEEKEACKKDKKACCKKDKKKSCCKKDGMKKDSTITK